MWPNLHTKLLYPKISVVPLEGAIFEQIQRAIVKILWLILLSSLNLPSQSEQCPSLLWQKTFPSHSRRILSSQRQDRTYQGVTNINFRYKRIFEYIYIQKRYEWISEYICIKKTIRMNMRIYSYQKKWYKYDTKEYSYWKIFEYIRISEYSSHPGTYTPSPTDDHTRQRPLLNWPSPQDICLVHICRRCRLECVFGVLSRIPPALSLFRNLTRPKPPAFSWAALSLCSGWTQHWPALTDESFHKVQTHQNPFDKSLSGWRSQKIWSSQDDRGPETQEGNRCNVDPKTFGKGPVASVKHGSNYL